jgi:hypothetical protein
MIFFRPTIKLTIVLLASSLLLNSCMTDDLDLSNGVNTEVTLGGDSLSVPIGSIQPITLGSMLDSLGLDILQKFTDESYSITMNDSTEATFSSIDPININISAISIDPIQTSLPNFDFPVFNINDINLNSEINIPTINGNISIPEIKKSTTTDKITLSAPSSPVKGNVSKKNTTSYPFSHTFTGSGTISQNIVFNNYGDNLKKINKIELKNSTLIITIDKSSINAIPFDNQQTIINLLQIHFPKEYFISSGDNSSIKTASDGHQYFEVSNDDISAVTSKSYSFNIDRLDLSNYPQTGLSGPELNYSGDITYNLSADFSAQASTLDGVAGKEITFGIDINATPALQDLNIETNDISISSVNGNSLINQTINNIPTDVSEISTITFNDNARLDINISKIDIAPLTTSDGDFVIYLPKMFSFDSASGVVINNAGVPVLTISHNELFGNQDFHKVLKIEKINLNKEISPDHSITLSDELSYTMNNLTIGSTTVNLSAIKSGNKPLAITAKMLDMIVKNADFKTNRISLSVPSDSAMISVNKHVADYVTKLYSLKMKNTVPVELKILVDGIQAIASELFFDNFQIKLPTKMKFANDSDLSTDNVLTLNGGFSTQTGFTKTLYLESFDFGQDGEALIDGNFVLNEKVLLNKSGNGKVYLKSTSLTSSDLSGLTITVKPSISIGTMELSLIEGKIDPQIDPISETVALDLPDALKNPSNNLDIQNPVIKFEIGNTLGIPMNLDLNIIPKRNGQPITGSIVSTTIPINKASTIGQFTWSKLYLAKDTTAVPSGYKAVLVSTLPNLLSTIPDEIEIQATPRVTGDRQVVDLYSTNNTIKLKYDVNVPLTFGKNFNIIYQDTINNLKESLSQFAKYAKQVDLVAIVKNGIPLNLGLEMTPLDSNGEIIDSDSISLNISDYIKAGTYNETSTSTNTIETPISLGIKDNTKNGDGFTKINGFIIKISATVSDDQSTVNGVPLKSDQSVGLDLRVSIPKGITIDLSGK